MADIQIQTTPLDNMDAIGIYGIEKVNIDEEVDAIVATLPVPVEQLDATDSVHAELAKQARDRLVRIRTTTHKRCLETRNKVNKLAKEMNAAEHHLLEHAVEHEDKVKEFLQKREDHLVMEERKELLPQKHHELKTLQLAPMDDDAILAMDGDAWIAHVARLVAEKRQQEEAKRQQEIIAQQQQVIEKQEQVIVKTEVQLGEVKAKADKLDVKLKQTTVQKRKETIAVKSVEEKIREYVVGNGITDYTTKVFTNGDVAIYAYETTITK